MHLDRISWEVEEHSPTAHPAKQQAVADPSPQGVKKKTRKDCQKEAKMRYRCTRCGEPKNNHECKYQDSIQRHMGIMVYPASNAFCSKEPGDCTPALSEMNNFVSYESLESNESPSTARASSPRTTVLPPHAKKVSPTSSGASPEASNESMGAGPFVESAALCPAQFRTVSIRTGRDAFRYLSVPASFPERKRLSDTLFVLSQQLQQATEEIGGILNEARERGLWDLAVAELLTQTIVALYCGEGDKLLDGLRGYLLRRGISC